MLQEALPEGQPLTAGTFRNMQTEHPMLEPPFAVSRMVAFISHDLRQPLTAILANAEFLTRSDISEMERFDFYREIRWDIDRINDLVSSLLECSKGRDVLRPAVGDVVNVIERAIRMTSAKKEFRQITIARQHKGRAVGWFDANRLERAVANLVLNACEAVDARTGQIVIATTGNKDTLQIEISDNGPGIPAAIRDSIFQPFVTCGKAEGSGLGLAIAKKIIEDHGGVIRLDDRCKPGASFTIRIPFAMQR